MSIKNRFMESTKSYYLYKLEEKYTGQDWMSVIPSQYSIDGNGTMPRVLKSDYEEVCDGTPVEPLYRWVDTDEFICEESYSSQYLTIESLENNNVISWMAGAIAGGGITAKTISASTDNGVTWTAYTSTSGGTSIASLNTGQKVLLKGLNYNYHINSFGSTGQFKVYGNIMSLISGDTFENVDTLTNIRSFSYLFSGATGLTSAENLVMPATSLTNYCYEAMFKGCTSLTTAPELPATTLAIYCYDSMFDGCTSLTTAPALPATTLASNCYEAMFWNCTSLRTAPELPATTLAQYCYYLMFENCTSLTTAPELPATTLADTCYSEMFNGCTSLTTAPALPATTLASTCYYSMFEGCTSLNYIKCLATNISASNCTYRWVSGVASSGTFVKASGMNDWTTGTSGIPNNWTVQNA